MLKKNGDHLLLAADRLSGFLFLDTHSSNSHWKLNTELDIKKKQADWLNMIILFISDLFLWNNNLSRLENLQMMCLYLR